MSTGEYGQERQFENKAFYAKQLWLDQKLVGPPGDSPLVTTSTVAALSHMGSLQRLNSESAITFTIPPDATAPNVGFENGDCVYVVQWGAGQANFVAGSGVTLRYKASLGLNLLEQYSIAGAIKVGANEWLLFGDLTA
jgi:hypothetical protein